MAEQIQTINDKTQYEKICNHYFHNNEVYLKRNNGDIEIKYMGYSDGTVAFKIPYLKNLAGDCLIISRRDDKTLHANVKYSSNDKDGSFIFRLLNFQVITLARAEDRKSLDTGAGSGKAVIFITNVISDFIIQNTLALHEKRVDDIKEMMVGDFKRAFKYIKIFFCNEGSGDARMKHFQAARRLIFVPDFKKKPSEEDKEANFFINNIYAKDYYLQNRDELMSEISVPIMYRMRLPYGYIQINNSEPLNDSTLSIIKKVAVRIDESVTKEKFFPPAGDKMVVSNVTMKGFGVVFKDRKYIRYFKVNSYVILDMLLPGEKKASILAIVRNISILENKIIKIGFQIDDLDALSEVHYQEFVESLNPPDK